MKAGKENSSEKKLQQKRHPVRQKLLSVLLCVCLLAVSLPAEFYGGKVQAEGVKKKILSFSDLPAEVKHQTVEVGTSERKLNLPGTLTAVCVSMENESTIDIEDMGNIENLSQPEISSQIRGADGEEEVLREEYQKSFGGNGEAPQENRLEEMQEHPADGSRIDAEEQLESPADSGAGREEFPEIVPEDGGIGRSFEETVVIENITWMSVPSYDSETEGGYDFLPVLPEEYALADGVELPEIQVEVRNEEVAEEGKERRRLESAENGKKEADGGAQEIEYFASSARESQVISADTTWDEEKTLSSGELVINEGVVLTINDWVDIRGNVTIRGGGTIAKGSANARINVGTDSSLTVLGVTMDGKSIGASFEMLQVRGELTLDGGCRIENCAASSKGLGGAVHVGGTATFNDCVIENCNDGAVELWGKARAKATATFNNGCVIENCSGVAGGAVNLWQEAQATFNGCVIKNCSAMRGGAVAVELSSGTATFNSCVIENCSAEDGGGAVNLVHGTQTTFNDCVIENCSAGGCGGAVNYDGSSWPIRSTAMFNDCVIENCSAEDGGAVDFMSETQATFNDCVIENCSANCRGGAIICVGSTLTIKGGTYRNNKTTSLQTGDGVYGGGFLCSYGDSVRIYGGNFIGNTTVGKGGSIYQAEYSTRDKPSEICIYGGTFQGNSSSLEEYEGSGGVYLSSWPELRFEISDNVEFCGDGTDSGVDGIYLDSSNAIPRKIEVSNTLSYPTTLYVNAAEGYVLAEGTGGYQLNRKDLKKIKFVDVGNSGETWYAVLDTDNNQIKLSRTDQYFITYRSNGAEGEVTDDTEYQLGDKATVKSAEGLNRKGFAFVEWNTAPDRSGTAYQPKDELEIQGDVELYAIFQEKKKRLNANFYSGSSCEKKVEYTEVNEDADSGTVTAPTLQEMEGWEPVGWEEENPSGYDGKIKPQEEIILLKAETDYYGVYQKQVTLSYEGQGAEGIPESQEKTCYANVHDKITYQEGKFTVGAAPSKDGFNFVGWNTQEDGQGTFYQPGSELKIIEDTVLFAVFQEEGKKTFLADFYSGEPIQKVSKSITVGQEEKQGAVIAPSLQGFPGWNPAGWGKSKTGFEISFSEQAECTLTEALTEYYGIYQKDVTLSYDANGGDAAPKAETKLCHANVHGEISYDMPEFTIGAAASREGYAFQGWNAKADGSGDMLQPGASHSLDVDTILYAVWKEIPGEPEDPEKPENPEEPGDPEKPENPAEPETPKTASYQVEYYCQNLTRDAYTRMDGDTKLLTGEIGTEAKAPQTDYTGFTLNPSHPLAKPQGTIEQDGSLALKLYYDRIVYEVDFDLNGGYGAVPDTQKIRYGGLLEKAPDPARKGYNFKGWQIGSSGMDEGLWDFERPVEYNTGTLHTTLYAKWADELAPEMGEASFRAGSRKFLDWLIQKETMTLEIPVTEEGSGLAKAEYLLVAEDGTEKEGRAQIAKAHPLADNMAPYGTGAFVIRGAQAQAEEGSYKARIVIEEEFKGKAYLTCTDHAGNVSPQKILTAAGGGIIVEDNAPEIHFSNTKETTGGKPLKVKVRVTDDIKNHVTGGISAVRYQVDKEKEKALPEEDFAEGFVETYEFTVKISGEGTHTLRVEAQDHAGNESAAQVAVTINGEKDTPLEIPEDSNPEHPQGPAGPAGGEPRTGDSAHVQIYATIAMIAGFGYLLLYFQGESGITEKEKEEIVYRLVAWAKQGGSIRRRIGIAIIFLFLAYYHSIGKSVDVEWKSVRSMKQ